MKAPVITLTNVFYHGTPAVSWRLGKDFGIIAKVKTLKGAAWSQSRGFWYNVKIRFNTVFSNHNLEQRMGLRFIQELLGHESFKTSDIYTHVSQKDFAKFNNPFDDNFFDDG